MIFYINLAIIASLQKVYETKKDFVYTKSFERETGFEPATFSLEG